MIMVKQLGCVEEMRCQLAVIVIVVSAIFDIKFECVGSDFHVDEKIV